MPPRKPARPEFPDRLKEARERLGLSLRDVEHRQRAILFEGQDTLYSRTDLRGFSSEKLRRAEAGEIPEIAAAIDVAWPTALAHVYGVPLTDLIDVEHVDRIVKVADLVVRHVSAKQAAKVKVVA